MGLFGVYNIAASGMTAERLRADIIANNIANVNTTNSIGEQPYRRQVPIFSQRGEFASLLHEASLKFYEPDENGGVRVVRVAEDPGPFRMIYDPGHPKANKDGYVLMPNVEIVKEMVDMISATRSYEANVSVMDAAKSMASKALSLSV